MSYNPVHANDCDNLSATELRKRYPSEANTHRNMLARGNTHGRVISPEFKKFRDFLRYVGPRPCNGATLDRIDNDDPEYAPGKVRWADKRTQNSNKGDSLLFYYSRTGDTYTVSRLAKLRGVSPGAIRKRRERGWSDDEVIEGKRRSHLDQGDAPAYGPVCLGTSKRWQDRSTQNGENVRLPPTPFEENRNYALRYRQEHGVEYCIPTYSEAVELLSPYFKATEEQYIFGRFAKWWNVWKHHVRRHDLPEWTKSAIAKIEAAQGVSKPSATDRELHKSNQGACSPPVNTDALCDLL